MINEIINLYKNGDSVLLVANKLNLPYRKVRNVLSKRNLIRSRIKIKDDEFECEYFYNIDTQEKAYFLGLFHGDGCVHITPQKGYRFCINLIEEDGYIIHKLLELLKLPRWKARRVIPSNGVSKPQISFQTGNKLFIQPLLNIKNYSVIEQVPKNLRNHFLRGVFDADGTIYTHYGKKVHKYYYMGYIGNEALIKIVSENSPVPFKWKPIKSKSIYRSEIYSKDNVLRFGEYLYKDSIIHLNRKYAKFIDAKFHYSSSTTTRKAPNLMLEGGDIV